MTGTLTTNEGLFFPNPRGYDSLCLDFAPLKGSKIAELAARWDIVLGYIPEA